MSNEPGVISLAMEFPIVEYLLLVPAATILLRDKSVDTSRPKLWQFSSLDVRLIVVECYPTHWGTLVVAEEWLVPPWLAWPGVTSREWMIGLVLQIEWHSVLPVIFRVVPGEQHFVPTVLDYYYRYWKEQENLGHPYPKSV